LKFTLYANKEISEAFQSIYPVAKCQSDRDISNINAFRSGLSSVNFLKVKESFDRIFPNG
jgi:hypothetical protein